MKKYLRVFKMGISSEASFFSSFSFFFYIMEGVNQVYLARLHPGCHASVAW